MDRFIYVIFQFLSMLQETCVNRELLTTERTYSGIYIYRNTMMYEYVQQNTSGCHETKFCIMILSEIKVMQIYFEV